MSAPQPELESSSALRNRMQDDNVYNPVLLPRLNLFEPGYCVRVFSSSPPLLYPPPFGVV